MKSTPIKIACILFGLLFFIRCTESNKSFNSEKQERALPDTVQADTTDIDLQDKTAHEDSIVDDKAAKAAGWPKKSKFTKENTRILIDALAIAVKVTEDPLFNQIISELAESKEIDWGNNRLNRIPRTHRNAPTAFI